MGRYKSRVSAQPDPRTESRLDQELEQTFPASDAPQITRDPPPHVVSRGLPKSPAATDKTRKSSV